MSILRGLVYIFQSENYDSRRFIGFAYRHLDWWRLERRGKLDWTQKARLLHAITVVAYLGSVLTAVALSDTWVAGLVCGVIMTAGLPFVLVVASWAIAPLERFLKRRAVAQARVVMDGSQAQVIGITGSFGKTSMKEILATLLEESFVVVKTPENINTDLGVAEFIRTHAKTVREAEVFIVEMGAHRRGDIQSLCALVRPLYSILTGIGEAHIERFGSLENIVRAKFELPRATGKCAILNVDNRYVREAQRERSAITCEMVEVSGGSASHIVPVEDFGGLTFEWQGERFETKLLGRHNVSLFILGMTLARKLGVSLESLRERVARVAPVVHRLQPIHNTLTDIWILDDSYNGNREGALSAIEVLSRAKGRKVVLTPGLVELGEKSRDIHRELAAEYLRVADQVLLIRSVMTGYIEAYFVEKGYTGFVTYATTAEAHADLSRVLRRGDTILFQNDLTDNYF